MLRIKLIGSFSFLVLGTALAGTGGAQSPAPAAAGGARPAAALTSTASLGACFDSQARILPLSGIVLAARGDEVFFRLAGFSDPEGSVPIRRDTRFRLASVNKTMTAILIGQLADQDRLSLDDPIGRHIPDLPPELAAITIDQLIQHRSGLGSYMTPANIGIVTGARTARDILPAILRERPSFPPGERQQYSNSGYILLGVIIENISGRSYGEHLRTALLDPLGMASTGIEPDSRMATPMTRMRGPGQPPASVPHLAQMSLRELGSPAGNAVSTADDMLRFGRALLGGRLLRPETLSRLFPPRRDGRIIGQAGGAPGVNADFAAMTESGWVLIVLTNFDPPAGELMGLVLRSALLGRGCRTLTEADRPSPFRGPGPGGPGPGQDQPRPPST